MSRSLIMSGVAGNDSFIELYQIGEFYVVSLEARRDGSIESYSFEHLDEAQMMFYRRCTQRIR